MSTVANKIFIPASLKENNQKIIISRPWYLREKDESPEEASPAILQFRSDEFMDDFFAGINKSPTGKTESAFENLVAMRDYSEVPVAMTDITGAGLYPVDGIDRDDNPANDFINEADEGLVKEDWLRKLYLTLHQHFYLVAIELSCETQGYPRVDQERIIDSGLIVRRLVPDSDNERWEDWITVDNDKGTWYELADKDMQDLSGQENIIQPLNIIPNIPASDLANFYASSGLAPDSENPVPLQFEKLALIPKSSMPNKQYTSLFGYLPLTSAYHQVPNIEGDVDEAFSNLKANLREDLEKKWLDLLKEESEVNEQNIYKIDHINSKIQDFLKLLIIPDSPNGSEVNAARTALHAPSFGVPDISAQLTLIHTIHELMELAPAEGWFDLVITEALNKNANTLPYYWDDTDSNFWDSPIPPDREESFRVLMAWNLNILLENVLFSEYDYKASLLTNLSSDQNFTNSVEGDNVLSDFKKNVLDKLIINALVLYRDEQIQSIKNVYSSVFQGDQKKLDELNGKLDRVNEHNHPVMTIGKLVSELELWISTENSYIENPIDITFSDREKELHNVVFTLTSMYEKTDGSGDGYIKEISERAEALEDDYFGIELSSQGINLMSPLERGLLIFPGSVVTDATIQETIDLIINRYHPDPNSMGELTEKEQRFEASNLLNLVRPRYDSDSIYCVQCFVKIAGRHPCEEDKVIWSKRSEPFSIAEPTDILGVRPVAMQLPDLKKMIRDIPRIPQARANPFASVNIPPDSDVSVDPDDMKNISRKMGIQMICSFGIPVFTICAWILFSIILNILLLIPGFAWLLLLKFCIPVPTRK